MDAARTIKRLGASKVTIVYRRKEEQMTAEKKDISEAKKEGIQFEFKSQIVKILGKEQANGIECVKTELIIQGNGTRPYPVNIEGSNYNIDADYVVMAIGSGLDEKTVNKLGIEINDKKYIKIDANYMTNIPGIFAGGDAIGEIATVTWASKSGRNAGAKIKLWIENQKQKV